MLEALGEMETLFSVVLLIDIIPVANAQPEEILTGVKDVFYAPAGCCITSV